MIAATLCGSASVVGHFRRETFTACRGHSRPLPGRPTWSEVCLNVPAFTLLTASSAVPILFRGYAPVSPRSLCPLPTKSLYPLLPSEEPVLRLCLMPLPRLQILGAPSEHCLSRVTLLV